MRLPGRGAAIFLDRDGTVNREVGYLGRTRGLELLPGAATAIGRFKRAGYRVILITNQSGVARGLFSLRRMKKINARLARLLRKQGARLDGIYSCPWHTEGKPGPFRQQHPWRKPAPGMLLAAADHFEINLNRSWMIGDRQGDIEAGQRAGCRTILLQTGYGLQAEKGVGGWLAKPDHIALDLSGAAKHILGEDDG